MPALFCAFVEVPLVVHVVPPETQERDASQLRVMPFKSNSLRSKIISNTIYYAYHISCIGIYTRYNIIQNYIIQYDAV